MTGKEKFVAYVDTLRNLITEKRVKFYDSFIERLLPYFDKENLWDERICELGVSLPNEVAYVYAKLLLLCHEAEDESKFEIKEPKLFIDFVKEELSKNYNNVRSDIFYEKARVSACICEANFRTIVSAAKTLDDWFDNIKDFSDPLAYDDLRNDIMFFDEKPQDNN